MRGVSQFSKQFRLVPLWKQWKKGEYNIIAGLLINNVKPNFVVLRLYFRMNHDNLPGSIILRFYARGAIKNFANAYIFTG